MLFNVSRKESIISLWFETLKFQSIEIALGNWFIEIWFFIMIADVLIDMRENSNLSCNKTYLSDRRFLFLSFVA